MAGSKRGRPPLAAGVLSSEFEELFGPNGESQYKCRTCGKEVCSRTTAYRHYKDAHSVPRVQLSGQNPEEYHPPIDPLPAIPPLEAHPGVDEGELREDPQVGIHAISSFSLLHVFPDTSF